MYKVEKLICYSHKLYVHEKICKKVIALKIQKLFHWWQRYVLNYTKLAQIVLCTQIDQQQEFIELFMSFFQKYLQGNRGKVSYFYWNWFF